MRSTESKCEHLTLEGALDTTGEGSKEQDEHEGQVLELSPISWKYVFEMDAICLRLEEFLMSFVLPFCGVNKNLLDPQVLTCLMFLVSVKLLVNIFNNQI